MEYTDLAEAAVQARRFSYSPYSGFRVGAALLSQSGRIFTGCNIENAGYTATNCAERTAFFRAVAQGERRFSAIAIAGGRERLQACPPCGVCLQVMMEFCDPENFAVVLVQPERNNQVYTLKQLLPMGFGPENVNQ